MMRRPATIPPARLLAAILLAALAPLTSRAAGDDGGTAGPIDGALVFRDHPHAPVETIGTVVIRGETVTYRARAGAIRLFTPSGEPRATMFFTSYDRLEEGPDGTPRPMDPAARPVTFCFNGGPGSSSVWLHLGLFGPRRVAYADPLGHPGPPPYGVVPNEHALLDRTDLVFIDPVSTGFSRAAEGVSEKDYHGVDADIDSVASFIVRYLSENDRWRSPRYLGGESYGTTRAAGLVDRLHTRHGVPVSGLILVSAVLDFSTIRFDTGNDLPYVLILPTYTATAAFHGALDEPEASMPLPDLLAEVRRFALREYAPALLLGDRLPESEAAALARRLAAYTGLDEAFIRDARLRVTQQRFCKALLRDRGLTVGRLDGRFTGTDADDAGERPEHDPSYAAILGNYTESLNAYLRSDLGYTSDLDYEILTSVWPWSYDGASNRYLNVAERLRSAMSRQPHLRVFIASGRTDLATPFFATEHTVAHMGLRRSLRANVEIREYDAGHMMYVAEDDLAGLSADLAAWYDARPAR